MADYTPDVYTGDGNQTDYTVSFSYLKEAYVEVYLDGALQTQGAGNDYTFPNASTISFTTAPAAGVNIHIKRATARQRLVDFQDATSVSEATMDLDSDQIAHLAEEAFAEVDRSIVLGIAQENYDVDNKKLTNVTDPTANQDAATMKWVNDQAINNGNVPTPQDPADDNRVLRATGGSFGWYDFLIDWISDAAGFMKTFLKSNTKADARDNLDIDGASKVIVAGDLADGAVETAKLDANAVTLPKSAQLYPARDGVLAPHNNLTITNGTTPASQVTVTADELIVTDASGNHKLLTSVSEADIDITVSGAGGLDTGAEASSTWYHIWIIAKPDGTVAGLLSTSSSAPTMPSGYTFKGYVGAIQNDSSSDFLTFNQVGKGASVESITDLSGGTSESYASVSLTIPSTAIKWRGDVALTNNVAGNATVDVQISPRNSVSHVGAHKNRSFINNGDSAYIPNTLFLVEDQTLYYQMESSSSRTTSIVTTGWEF